MTNLINSAIQLFINSNMQRQQQTKKYDKDYFHKRYLENREVILAKGKQYRERPEVKERVARQHHEHYLKNRSVILAKKKIHNKQLDVKQRNADYHKKYYLEHKEELKRKNRERYHRMKNAKPKLFVINPDIDN
jgi:hypothetical protein